MSSLGNLRGGLSWRHRYRWRCKVSVQLAHGTTVGDTSLPVELVVLFALAFGLYGLGWQRQPSSAQGRHLAGPRAYGGGLLALALALLTPVADYSDVLLTAHMVQHLLSTSRRASAAPGGASADHDLGAALVSPSLAGTRFLPWPASRGGVQVTYPPPPGRGAVRRGAGSLAPAGLL